MKKRSSGILCHISSLPSAYGVGNFGPDAYRFADFLVRAKQGFWQTLPINTPAIEIPHSPYWCLSVFAGDELFISPEMLYQRGLLTKEQIKHRPTTAGHRIDYKRVIPLKQKLLHLAYENFKAKKARSAYERFCGENKDWLEDFALFAALREHFRPGLWCDWPKRFRDRDKHALGTVKKKFSDAIEKEKFLQYEFFSQWRNLKKYCNRHGIKIIGDIPIYVAYDSSDVWGNPEIFKLTRAKKPKFIAGVGPDYFSKTGQLWGNPVYDWESLRKKGYRWWLKRIEHNLQMFDMVRLDHFRGFVDYWQVPAGHKTAEKGKWVAGPKQDFLKKVLGRFTADDFVTEDLGNITDEVKGLIEKFHLRSMKVITFGFDGDLASNPHCPYNHVKNSVVYAGTHDTNTIKGWYRKETKREQKKRISYFLGHKPVGSQIHWELIRLAMNSVSQLAIIPMQDILGLGEKARMNLPGTIDGNWGWRFGWKQVQPAITRKLARLTKRYGRS